VSVSAIDQLRVTVAQRAGIGPALGQRVRTHVGDEHVGAASERFERASAVVGREIEHHAALVPVAVEIHRAHPGMHLRPEMTRDVTGRRLDLDHVGAEISEQQRGVRSRHDRGEIDHAHSVER
jgi:hypothetical protein